GSPAPRLLGPLTARLRAALCTACMLRIAWLARASALTLCLAMIAACCAAACEASIATVVAAVVALAPTGRATARGVAATASVSTLAVASRTRRRDERGRVELGGNATQWGIEDTRHQDSTTARRGGGPPLQR